MNLNEFLDEILLEVSVRVKEGYPNFKNPIHIRILSEILSEYGLNEIKYELIENLIEAEEDYKHIGAGIYIAAKDAETDGDGTVRAKNDDVKKYRKDGEGEGASFTAISDDEVEKIKQAQGDAGEKAAANTAQNQPKDDSDKSDVGSDGSQPEEEKPDAEKDPNFWDYLEKDKDDSTSQISPENKKITDDFQNRVEKRIDNLNDTQKVIIKESLKKINIIYNDSKSKEEKREAAKWLVDNAGFSTNENRKKAYFNKLGGNRKIISGDAGTTKSADLVSKVSALVELKTFDAKGVKQGFTTAAKPDLGNENIIKPSDDERVSEYFKSHTVLKKIRPSLHGIFGLKDENGNVKMPSNDYSKDYLEQSINNPALQNTIDFAKEQVKNNTVDEGVLNGLESHKQRMDDILKNAKIPSTEAAQAIADSYNKLMVDLHKADADVANAILKQLAENNLYEQELANGEEVYLPSAGNFPAGDKIKGGSLERVSLVSCKWGKSGRTYGCPANSKTICELHQDKSKQNNQGMYLGQDGYTLLINDDLIKGESNEETKLKTTKFINDTLNEIGLSDTFNDEEISKISSIVANYMDEVDRIKKEVSDKNPADTTQYWKMFGKSLSEIENKYKADLGSIITKEHASALIGENNAGNLVQKSGVKVESLLSAIEISNNIRTNQTLNELEHNKQYYDENGEPKFVTDNGTNTPNDYSITFRTKRTAGRTGGGCQLSFTGDGKPVDIDLNDDGVAVNHKSGKELDI